MRRRSHALVTLAAAAACVAAGAGAADASPQDLFSLGPRSVAMGGTGVSIADDASAVYVNPAGLSRATHPSLVLGYEAAGYRTWTAVGSREPRDASLDPTRGMLVGLVLPIPLPAPIGDRVAFGMALHLPVDVIARNRVVRPETPQFLLLENRSQAISLQGGLGVRLPGGIRIGGGAAALAALGGSLTIQNDPSGNITWQIDDRIVVTYAPMAGASWERGPLRIGATWRAALVGQLQVRVTAHDLGINIPPVDISGVPQYDPWQIALEAGFAPAGWAFALGLTFKRWSEYPGPLARTTALSPIPPAVPLADTFVVRAGAEHRWSWHSSSFIARAGYFYEPSPLPNATGVANYLDNDRHVASLGLALAGHLLGTTLTVDVFAQQHFLVSRTAVKDSSVSADNAGAPSIRSGGTLFFVGTSATVSL